MSDISQTIIAKSDQLNAGDLMGGGVVVTVKSVTVSKGDQPVSVYLTTEGMQPYKPCLSMRRVLAKLWTTDSNNWIGRSMTLYCDPTVIWAGKPEGGIRISHMTDIAGKVDIPLRSSKRKVITYTIEPLTVKKTVQEDPKTIADEFERQMCICDDLSSLQGVFSAAYKWAKGSGHYLQEITKTYNDQKNLHGGG